MLASIRLCSILIFVSALLLAQDSSTSGGKIPTGLEEALRQRVTEFYKLQMDGKFRASEAYVCEASKDDYYSSEKTKWIDFQIVGLSFDDELKTAQVKVTLKGEIPSFIGRFISQRQLTAKWQLEGGNWCYSMPKVNRQELQTWVGTMRPGPEPHLSPNSTPDSTSGPPKDSKAAEPEAVLAAVKLSRPVLHLKAAAKSTDATDIVNTLPGEIELQLRAPETPGVRWNLAETKLASNASTKLLVEFDPKGGQPPPAITAEVVVQPTGQRLSLTLRFDQ
jgi:hypothetical protein